MANRYPLVANASTLVLEEVPAADTILIDNLNVTATANLGAVGNITITGGTNGQLLRTNGSGVLSWTSDTSPPSGANTEVMFNDAGNMNAVSNFTFNKFTNNLSVTGNLIASGTANITGTANVGNVATSGTIVATGNITGGNILAQTGTVFANNITVGQNGGNLIIDNTGGFVFECFGNSSNYVGFLSPNDVSVGNITWTLPNTTGNVGEFLTTLGNGAMQFATVVSSSAPGSNSANGQSGTIAFDSDYIYVCIAANTWKRVGISTWP
jgi:hypothetical protein